MYCNFMKVIRGCQQVGIKTGAGSEPAREGHVPARGGTRAGMGAE